MDILSHCHKSAFEELKHSRLNHGKSGVVGQLTPVEYNRLTVGLTMVYLSYCNLTAECKLDWFLRLTSETKPDGLWGLIKPSWYPNLNADSILRETQDAERCRLQPALPQNVKNLMFVASKSNREETVELLG